MGKRLSIISIILLSFFMQAGAQTLRRNIDILNDLLDLSVAAADSSIGGTSRNIQLDFNSPRDYSILKNSVMSTLSGKNYNLISIAGEKDIILNYTLSEIKVSYGVAFRKSFLGEVYLPREISLRGSYSIGDGRQIKSPENFEFTEKDTIAYDSVSEIQNSAVPFTAGEVPAEPFPSSLLEPVIAVGTLVVAVILLFTVRSK